MLSDLKACRDRKDLAILLGIAPKELSYTLYIMPNVQKYTPFCINKKNGATRNILAPSPRLKWIQRRLLDVLYECEVEIETASGTEPNLCFGFRRRVNIFENARPHRNRRFVFNLDIQDYFDQFNFGRIRAFFIRDRDYQLPPPVATVIAQIACFNNVLPQGSPCSPHIANLATRFFDIRMTRFLRRRRCGYTRYADDITISTNRQSFPNDVALPDPSGAQGWQAAPTLNDIFARAGFSINQSKLRMSTNSSRQSVTGLVVNDRPNVSRDYYLTTRAMCHNLFTNGTIIVPEICDGYGKNCPDEEPKPSSNAMHALEGRLSYIHYIREKWDERAIQEKQDEPTQFWSTMQLFYLYKYFFGNQTPTIITEGPSDVYYVKTALLKTTINLPEMLTGTASPTIIPSFFKFGKTPGRVLGLTGGAGNIKRFLYLHNKFRGKFNPALSTQPVIILVDNDSGGADVLSMVNGVYKTNIKITDSRMDYRISRNLYLVKTAHTTAGASSCIEDFLPSHIQSVKLNGKTFSSAKKFDTSKHFGKVALASYVQANASSIDLSGLDTLLQALNDSVAAAHAELAAVTP